MNFYYDDLLEKIIVVMKKLSIMARISPNSIEATIYRQYAKAYEIVEKRGDIKDIRLNGCAKAFVDSNGDYSNPILNDMSNAEKALEMLKGAQNGN